jgi:outer membrane protein
MKKIFITAVLLIGLVMNSNAQSFWAINWDISKGVGDTGDFIGNVNVRGASLDGRVFINDNIAIGGHLGWSTLYEKLTDQPPFEVEEDGIIGDISGTQLHYLNSFPLLVTAHYYFESGKIKPYAGIGLGGVWTEQRTDVGLRSFQTDSFGFGVQPEVGVFIPVGLNSSGLNLAMKYLYGTSAGDLDSLGIFTFSIGFAFMN